MKKHILAIDQGTTSTRVIIFDAARRPVAIAQEEFPQHFPASGWVEHEPEDIWRSVLNTCREALRKAKLTAGDIAGIGITNQRETAIIWDKRSGEPIHNAIVWQDRRTAALCARMKGEGLEELFTRKTGLLLDPYFAGTKFAWLLDNVEGARARAEAGELLAGTVDSFLIWRLTAGAVHATDATNASRTLLYDIEANEWDDELLSLLNVPRALLPEVHDCAADFGEAAAEHFGAPVPILGVAGDQHAALIGQACFEPGMIKSTYGTGCFAVLNTGEKLVRSKNRLLSTIAYRLSGRTVYALEGSIFVAGAAIQWLRDGLGLLETAAQSESLAHSADPAEEVYMVPAFVGLGAPWWDAEARGAIFGLTRKTGPAELARAALESVAFQTNDLLQAMKGDRAEEGKGQIVLRVDGGMVENDWAMQRLADILDAPVDRPVILETTALGAAWLAGHQCGLWPAPSEFAREWELETRFSPAMDVAERASRLEGWGRVVERTLSDGG